MASINPRIVIIGAGMAGLTAANKLYTQTKSDKLFDLLVVEGGSRIGGRINSSEFCGDRIEQGATWIHGIEGSPIHKICQDSNLLQSNQPWECRHGFSKHPITVAEGGHELSSSLVEPISRTFKNLMSLIQGKANDDDADGGVSDSGIVSSRVLKHCTSSCGDGSLSSVGSFLRRGLEGYWELSEDGEGVERIGSWSKKSLEEAVFAMHENTLRSIEAVDNLCGLDLDGQREYEMFPGEDITIARGYSSVVEHLASVLPVGMVQLGRKVERIEWRANGVDDDSRPPVTLHFSDGSTVLADHVVVTVSLGVLKQGINEGSGLFSPPLPGLKIKAISRLGFGVLDKVFLRYNRESSGLTEFPSLQMVFHKSDSEFRDSQIPNWMRRTSLLYPIYRDSRVLLSWFAGREALEVEALTEDEIADGFSTTLSKLLSSKLCNGKQLKFEKVLRTQWAANPLFLGSYSYVAVGSSGDDMDALAEPLPEHSNSHCPTKLQILFAGEATHRKHYGTTHAAYLSGLREANRLLEYYGCISV